MSINRILADLGKAVDSSSTGNFLNKEASGAEFNPVQWSDINSAPTILDSALASAIIDSAYVQARQTGVGSGGIDSATTIALIDSSYVGARASTGGSGFVKYQYTATASQTTFQDSDANGNVLSYDADYILVHYNGVLLPSADYTATDGSSVVLATGADSGSIIGIAKWGAAAGSSSGGSGSFALGGDRALAIGAGNISTNQIEYWSIPTPGNAADFGDITQNAISPSATSDGSTAIFKYRGTIETVAVATLGNSSSFGSSSAANGDYHTAFSDGTYAFWAGGTHSGSVINSIEYVTIATSSNTADFGDLSESKQAMASGADTSRGVVGGGNAAGGARNTIEYFATATPGNVTDFGDLLATLQYFDAAGDGTYLVFAGAYDNSFNEVNTMQYITIQTTSNATDFGDLANAASYTAAASDGTYGSVHLGVSGGAANNIIENFTIATPGNASDHGDLSANKYLAGVCAGSSS